MSNSVYQINKGINKSIEFKGLKAQYIGWLGAGVIGLLILFALLYIIGVNAFICLGIILVGGTAWCRYIYQLSRLYGAHGLQKKIASRSIPAIIRSNSRKIFILNKTNVLGQSKIM